MASATAETTKGPPEGDPLNLRLCGFLRRIRNAHNCQTFRFRLLTEVQRDAIASEEHNPRRRKLVVQHLVIAFERSRPAMCGPTRIEPRLRNAPRPRPAGRDHFRPVFATFVAEEDILIAVLLDPVANLVERIEDDVDIGPVGGTRDDQGHPFDLRLFDRLAIMLLQQLACFKDGSRLLGADAGARSRCGDEGMACLDLVALRRRLAHHLDGADDFPQVQEPGLGLFQSGLGDLRSVMALCQRADLVGGAVDLLAERDLAPLQDRRQSVGKRFDFHLKPGVAQLTEQRLEGLADDIVFAPTEIVEVPQLQSTSPSSCSIAMRSKSERGKQKTFIDNAAVAHIPKATVSTTLANHSTSVGTPTETSAPAETLAEIIASAVADTWACKSMPASGASRVTIRAYRALSKNRC